MKCVSQKKMHAAIKYLETKTLGRFWKQISYYHKQQLENWTSEIIQVVSKEDHLSAMSSNTEISKFCCYFAFPSFFHWEVVSTNSCIQTT